MTRTQCVVKVADAHRSKSQLHKLSFVWPRKVSRDGSPESANAQDATDNIPVHVNAESQGDLRGNAGTTPGGVTLFHGNHGVDKLLGWSFRPWSTVASG